MVSNKELRKIKKHRKKLGNFCWKMLKLSKKTPDIRIINILRRAAEECCKLERELTGDRLLKEQKQ